MAIDTLTTKELVYLLVADDYPTGESAVTVGNELQTRLIPDTDPDEEKRGGIRPTKTPNP